MLYFSVVLAHKDNKHPYRIGANTKASITVLSCASASGVMLSPLLLYPGKRWTFRPQDDFPNANVALTPKGWITEESFYIWLRDNFIEETKVSIYLK